jgi:hypothetical protein
VTLANHQVHVTTGHPPADDRVLALMTTQGPTTIPPQRYEILVRGRLGPTLLQAFPTLAAAAHGADTLLAGRLADQGALFGVLCEIDDLGLEIVEVRACGRSFTC